LRRFAARRRGCEGAILRRSLWLAALVCACALLVACGSRQASSNVQIVPIETTPGVAQAARPPSVTPAAGWSPTASVANVATSATPQTATATPALPDSYSIAIAPDALAAIGGAFDSLVGTVSGVTLQTQPAVDSSAALRAPADLALDLRQPGAPALTGAVAVRRQPIALAVPWLLAPDDLTLQQAVDLLTGVATNWSQAGGPARAVHLAESDPALLANVGALGNRPTAQPAAARVASAATLLAETDAGNDELAVVPWTGPWLKTKALRIDGKFPDDPGYPLVVETDVAPLKPDVAGHAPAQIAQQIGAALLAKPAPNRQGTLLLDAMGDFMLARGIAQMVQQHGEDWPFAAVKDRLASADLRYGNLELALTDRGAAANKDYTFRAPPAETQALLSAGINVVDLANNHVLDFGSSGLLDTEAALDGAGIAHVGAGPDDTAAHKPLISVVNGVRIAWLAYANVPDDSGPSHFVARSLEAGLGRPGVAWGTPDVVTRDVQAAKQQADVVIVALHSGYEYTDVPNTIQTSLAHAAIDAGAALVLGAHPHVLQGVEFYKNGVIAYSLGNFVFDLDESDRVHYGLPSVQTMVLRVALNKSGVTGLQVYPAIISATTYQPQPVSGASARPVFDRFERLTAALNPVAH
jgi:poly-gamma-glutamate capsule biosynthesis protein CapA/YwtB (metallophosphatase superfamily)